MLLWQTIIAVHCLQLYIAQLQIKNKKAKQNKADVILWPTLYFP